MSRDSCQLCRATSHPRGALTRGLTRADASGEGSSTAGHRIMDAVGSGAHEVALTWRNSSKQAPQRLAQRSYSVCIAARRVRCRWYLAKALTNSVHVQRVEQAWASPSGRPHAGLWEQCCGFDLDQHVGERETSDAEQGLGGAAVGLLEALGDDAPLRTLPHPEQTVYIGGVVVQPDNV
jgi:hypothetical protein